MRTKFAGLLRGLLRCFDDTTSKTVALPRGAALAAGPTMSPRSAFLQSPTPSAAAPGGLELPLPSVISVLPIDLRAKLLEPPPGDACLSIPVDKVLSQLAHGAVKISFGELRTARPGLFAKSGSENDARQIVLPLNEIITRISPTLLSRRAVKKMEPAADIAGPFGARGQGVSIPASALAKPAPLPSAAPAAQNPVAPKSTIAPKTAAVAPQPAPVISAPVASAAAVAPAPVKSLSSAPPPAAAATIPFSTAPAPAAEGFNAAPRIPVENPILAPLSALAEAWPEALKQELAQAELMGTQAALPFPLVESGLKRGRVTIPWKNLRAMLRPQPAPTSPYDGLELELPLQVLAPLFFASQKAAGQMKQKISVSEEIPDLFLGSSATAVATSAAPASAVVPKAAPVSPAPVAPIAPTASRPVQPVVSAPPAKVAASDASEQETVMVPLSALSENWPEPLRKEIAQGNLSEAQVALSLNRLAPAMKRGRALFTWRDLRGSIHPAPPELESVHDGVELELPLKVIAPLFLERQAPPARTQSRLTIDQSIPNPFSPFASAEEMKAPVPAPAAKPAPAPARPALKPVDAKLSETNYYVWGDGNDAPRVDASEYKRAKAPSTDFTRRHATPKEIVARAMRLPGVAGVVIALCDGLMIASEVPPNLNPDTAAAFLPQIFDRVAQCTRELRMGVLNNLKFTVGNVPWHIFHVNAIYFAAFGRAGASLPTTELASLAGQLDRKKQ